MNCFVARVAFLFSVFLGTASHAATYECEVVDAMGVNKDGKFKSDTDKLALIRPVGSKFTVDPTTGAVIGGFVNNRRGGAKEPILFGQGSGKHNKYNYVKIFSIIPEMGINDPFLLEIWDIPSYDTRKIPFSGYYGSIVISGLCKKYS